MLLPPLPVFRTEGLASYPQTPEITDKTNRGDLTGVRNDSITWVVEKPGAFEIPGIRFQWWDPVNRELKQQIVPGMSLDIQPSAVDETAKMTASDDGQNPIGTWLKSVFFLTGLLAGALWLRSRRNTNTQEVNDEKSAFAELQSACKNNRASQAHAAMHKWITLSLTSSEINSRPATLIGFARMLDDEELARELAKLQKALVSSGGDWRGDSLLAALQNTRQHVSHQRRDQSVNYLAPLNP